MSAGVTPQKRPANLKASCHWVELISVRVCLRCWYRSRNLYALVDASLHVSSISACTCYRRFLLVSRLHFFCRADLGPSPSVSLRMVRLSTLVIPRRLFSLMRLCRYASICMLGRGDLAGLCIFQSLQSCCRAWRGISCIHKMECQ